MASQPATLRPTGQVTNIWIQDANGKPQMIKLVHAVNTVGKSVPVSVVSAVSGAIRAVLKADGSVLTAKPQQKLHTGQVVRVPGPINGTLVRPVSQMIRLPVIHAENRNAVSITNSASTYQANHLQNNQLKLALPQQTIYHQQQLNNNHQLTNNTAHNPLLNLAMLGARTKRQDSDQGSDRKRPKTTPSLAKHGGRGLRYYATVICEKVKRKGITTYSEMADELVAEYKDGLPFTNNQGEFQQDEKNIRRRVYDALNVLVAMNIISKEKNKGMKWVGFPTDSKIVVENLEARKQELLESVKQKQQKVQELVLQQIAYKSLVQRNKQNEQIYGPPPRNSTLQLPFIVVNTNKKTLIEACISSDKLQYLFTFNNIFEIHDIGTVLERMGMTLGLHNANCTEENLAKAKSYVPKALQHYVDQLASGLNEPQLPENVNLEVPESSERSADVVTPTASFSLSFSDDEDFDDHVDDDDEDHSDGGIN